MTRSANHAPEACGAVSLRSFADRVGLREQTLIRWARAGRILGARKHPLTKKCWIFPPAKILFP